LKGEGGKTDGLGIKASEDNGKDIKWGSLDRICRRGKTEG
jgi:hypothetical protein